MGEHFPYTFYSCPCVDVSAELPAIATSRRIAGDSQNAMGEEDVEDDPQFNPRSPRADLGLVPLEYLLWCTECHEMRCNRCVLEEVVCWYCPTCLFEVPSSTVRSEGNRCTRNCYNCPICTSPLSVNALEAQNLDTKPEGPSGPFVLMCGWCQWSSLDIGIEFEKPNNLTAQLNKIKLSTWQGHGPTMSDDEAQSADAQQVSKSLLHPDEMFSRLTSFYRQQLTDATDPSLSSTYNPSDNAFPSPSNISRLLNMYSSKRIKRGKVRPMREALTSLEGLVIIDGQSDVEVAETQAQVGMAGTTDATQRAFQPGASPRFTKDLWPVASLLRTKRQKRCKQCRTLLVKPEARMTSSRWRIRLLALNHIPKISIRPLSVPAAAGPYMGGPPALGSAFEYSNLHTGQTYQYLLTAINPLFDPINITLATATITPGRVGSRVTILCPQFTVGANSDVWDEALGTSSKRRSVMPGSSQQPIQEERIQAKQAEAGQIWRKGRNWASIIVEIVPGMMPEPGDRQFDDDLLEIAVFVHIDYETAVTGEEKQVAVNASKEKRESAFWTVLGAGRIKSP